MNDSLIKKYCLPKLIIILCLVLPMTIISAQALDPVDTVINTSFTTLDNIQLQLNNFAQTIYINLVTGESNEPIAQQISIFNEQLTAVQQELTAIPLDSVTSIQSDQLQTLLAVSRYLTYFKDQLLLLATPITPQQQYTVFNNLFAINTLITQLISYSTLEQSFQ